MWVQPTLHAYFYCAAYWERPRRYRAPLTTSEDPDAPYLATPARTESEDESTGDYSETYNDTAGSASDGSISTDRTEPWGGVGNTADGAQSQSG